MSMTIQSTEQPAAVSALTAVQQTCLYTAFWRDREQKHRGLISDPQAPVLLDAFLSDELRQQLLASAFLGPGIDLIAVRSKLIDDAIMSRNATGPVQLVLLGAGMDTRAYRLGLHPESLVIEVVQEA